MSLLQRTMGSLGDLSNLRDSRNGLSDQSKACLRPVWRGESFQSCRSESAFFVDTDAPPHGVEHEMSHASSDDEEGDLFQSFCSPENLNLSRTDSADPSTWEFR